MLDAPTARSPFNKEIEMKIKKHDKPDRFPARESDGVEEAIAAFVKERDAYFAMQAKLFSVDMSTLENPIDFKEFRDLVFQTRRAMRKVRAAMKNVRLALSSGKPERSKGGS
jgi:succinylarginine dihydrolase